MIAKLKGGKRQLAVLIVIGLAASGVVGFTLGSRIYTEAMQEFRALERTLAERSAELETRNQELVNLQIADKVNRLTQENLRGKVSELQTALVKLEGEVYLYKNLVEDDEAEVGLNLESLTLYRTLEENAYSYRIVVRRKAALSQTVDASLSLSIEGRLAGIPHSLPFNEADTSLKEDSMAIRFKYFKVLQGTFVLPEHFVPETVVLSLYEPRTTGSLVIRELPWRASDF